MVGFEEALKTIGFPSNFKGELYECTEEGVFYLYGLFKKHEKVNASLHSFRLTNLEIMIEYS